MDAIEAEADANPEAFLAMLPELIRTHAGQYVLLRHRQAADFFASGTLATAAGRQQFPDGLYSVQEVTERPVDLGFFSHAIDLGLAYRTSAAG